MALEALFHARLGQADAKPNRDLRLEARGVSISLELVLGPSRPLEQHASGSSTGVIPFAMYSSGDGGWPGARLNPRA